MKKILRIVGVITNLSQSPINQTNQFWNFLIKFERKKKKNCFQAYKNKVNYELH